MVSSKYIDIFNTVYLHSLPLTELSPQPLLSLTLLNNHECVTDMGTYDPKTVTPVLATLISAPDRWMILLQNVSGSSKFSFQYV